MKNIQAPDIHTIYLLGDHHGAYKELEETINKHEIKDSLIIHVGDGSEGSPAFTPKYIQERNQFFEKTENHYWSIRGNHSDPSFFKGQHMLPNFKLLPDYTTSCILGQKWLFAGGAISIDRISQKLNKTWWKNEEFNLPIGNLKKCDVLVTHSGPPWIGPTFKSIQIENYENAENDLIGPGKSTLWKECQEERKKHETLFKKAKPTMWYIGHFHEKYETTHSGCHARILDKQELFPHRFPSLK